VILTAAAESLSNDVRHRPGSPRFPPDSRWISAEETKIRTSGSGCEWQISRDPQASPGLLLKGDSEFSLTDPAISLINQSRW
jgi:hypothetical protein